MSPAASVKVWPEAIPAPAIFKTTRAKIERGPFRNARLASSMNVAT